LKVGARYSSAAVTHVAARVAPAAPTPCARSRGGTHIGAELQDGDRHLQRRAEVVVGGALHQVQQVQHPQHVQHKRAEPGARVGRGALVEVDVVDVACGRGRARRGAGRGRRMLKCAAWRVGAAAACARRAPVAARVAGERQRSQTAAEAETWPTGAGAPAAWRGCYDRSRPGVESAGPACARAAGATRHNQEATTAAPQRGPTPAVTAGAPPTRMAKHSGRRRRGRLPAPAPALRTNGAGCAPRPTVRRAKPALAALTRHQVLAGDVRAVELLLHRQAARVAPVVSDDAQPASDFGDRVRREGGPRRGVGGAGRR
jgi:hypothetical protein